MVNPLLNPTQPQCGYWLPSWITILKPWKFSCRMVYLARSSKPTRMISVLTVWLPGRNIQSPPSWPLLGRGLTLFEQRLDVLERHSHFLVSKQDWLGAIERSNSLLVSNNSKLKKYIQHSSMLLLKNCRTTCLFLTLEYWPRRV